MGFRFNTRYGGEQPYYLGGAVAALSQGQYEVSLGGHPYMLDWRAEEPLSYAPVPFVRAQADQSDLPGEQTVNPEGFWRRSGESWHVGAGQDDYDRKDANPFRFRESIHMNVWEKWKLSLLPDTAQRTSSNSGNQKLAVAGDRLYWVDGTDLRYLTSVEASEASMRLEGGFTDTASTPDDPSFNGGDMSIRVRCTADDWTPGGLGRILIGQVDVTQVDESFFFGVNPTGNLIFMTTTNGSTLIPHVSTVATGFVDGSENWIRADLDVDNGAGQHTVTFFTSADGVVWVPLGAVVTVAGVINPWDSSSPLSFGPLLGWAGNIKFAEFIVGGVTVADPDFTSLIPGTMGFEDSVGNEWTLSGPGASIVDDTLPVTTVTGPPATAASDIATNGFHVWTAHGANGIYRTTRTSGAMASHITGTVSLLGFVRNRLLAAQGGVLYEVTAEGMAGAVVPLPAALYTHPNSDFAWVDFADLNGFIYLAGFSGDKSLIYKTAVTQDGTDIGIPTVAGVLPDGEVVTHINGYLGKFLFIGTTKGWRLAINSDNGDLNIGGLVETSEPVLASEGQEEFIYYGLGNFQLDNSGIGRLSTAQFSDLDNFVPAYASDLMGMANASTNSIVTFGGRTVFVLDEVGIFSEIDALCMEGSLDTGNISYNMTEPKIGVWLEVTHSEVAGGLDILVSQNDGPFVSVGAHDSSMIFTNHKFALGNFSAARTEFRIMLHRNEMDPTIGLTFNSWIFQVQPTAEPTDYIYATILIADMIEDLSGTDKEMIPYEELAYLSNLRRRRVVTTWQQSKLSYTVFLEDFKLSYKSLMREAEGHKDYNGSCLLKMKVVL